MRLSRERLALVFVLAGLAGVTVVASADAATPTPAQTAQSQVSPATGTAPRLAPTQIAIDPNTKLTELVSPAGVLASVKKGEKLKLTARRATPGTCEEVKLTVDGKSRIVKNVAFPWSIEIGEADALYPTMPGKYEASVEGVKGCTGRVARGFAFLVEVPQLPSWKPANGKLSSLSVPGGSFAEDEAQKIQASGMGGCAFDLTISNKSYGGSTENTWSVGPLKIEPASTLYNGTHFGTLAEGSWKATAVGTKGCTGSASIDFKVTPKTSTKKVMGKPVVAFDQAPKNGTTFSKSKDGNIWFKVTAPQSTKDEPNATCCEIEFNYKNEYGGWEVLPNSPFSDPSYKGALTGQSAVSFRSVSYFTDGREWRVRMRGSKYKTEFEWSDWLEFKVDQL